MGGVGCLTQALPVSEYLLILQNHLRKTDQSLKARCDPSAAPASEKTLRPIPCCCFFWFQTVLWIQTWCSRWDPSVPSTWCRSEFPARRTTSRRAHLQRRAGPSGRTTSCSHSMISSSSSSSQFSSATAPWAFPTVSSASNDPSSGP